MSAPPVYSIMCLFVTLATVVPASSQEPTTPPNVSTRIVIVGPDGKEHSIDTSGVVDAAAAAVQQVSPDWSNRAAIGVVAQELPKGIAEHMGLVAGQGVIVSKVLDESPATAAGLQEHDIIVQIGDEPVMSPADLQRLVQGAEGKTVDMAWLHLGERKSGPVTPVKGKELKAIQGDDVEFMIRDLSASLQGQPMGEFKAPGILLHSPQPSASSEVREQLAEINERISGLERMLQEIKESLKRD